VAETSSRAGRSLTPERIVELAVERADAGGLENVSMRKLAADLSVTPMALYWHFANRDALVDAMAERVAGELTYEDDPDGPWQERLRAVLSATLTVVRAHPWLGPLARRRIVPTPDYLRALEVMLDAVRIAGYGTQSAADVVDIAVDAVTALAAGLKEMPPGKLPPASAGQLEMRRTLLALPDGEYPRIREAAAPLTSPHPPATSVDLGIDILVKGIEAAAPDHRR
jgi:AcrR family transcriptional regulator